MLPYTPLHLLLFSHPEAAVPYRHLIMTSGNLKGRPIETDPRVAMKRLSGIADLFLYHNREILFRTDDSILRTDADTHSFFIRRSRGFVPEVFRINGLSSGVSLALGGDLKNAPAFAMGEEIYLAPYLGDLEDLHTRRDFDRQIEMLLDLYKLRPEILYYDTHPGYYSHQWALERDYERKVGVQHHHAHVLSVMAEHGLEEVLGLAFDGTGFGPDGTIWGGEFLHATRSGFMRLGSFETFPLPGGESAIRHPIRTGLAILLERAEGLRGVEEVFRGELTGSQVEVLTGMIEKRLNSPLTTSLGRIFDAAAAVLGLVREVSYEGEGPIKLEGLAAKAYSGGRPDREAGKLVPLNTGTEAGNPSPFFRLDPGPLIRHLAEKRNSVSAERLALRFHEAIVSSVISLCLVLRERVGISRAALSGGVFQNMLLRKLLIPELQAEGFDVYFNRKVPPGDGGLAVGQLYCIPTGEVERDLPAGGSRLVYRP